MTFVKQIPFYRDKNHSTFLSRLKAAEGNCYAQFQGTNYLQYLYNYVSSNIKMIGKCNFAIALYIYYKNIMLYMIEFTLNTFGTGNLIEI